MGEVCRDPEDHYFVWQSPFSLAIRARLVSSSNPTVDVTIHNLDLGSLLMELLIFSLRMAPLAHIQRYINNTVSQEWAHRGSVSTASSVEPILWELSLLDMQQHTHTSI